jgi:hypothetical protein
VFVIGHLKTLLNGQVNWGQSNKAANIICGGEQNSQVRTSYVRRFIALALSCVSIYRAPSQLRIPEPADVMIVDHVEKPSVN